MAREIITIEDLERFRLQLLEDLKQVMRQQHQPTKQWLRSSEVRKMLGVSHGTLQNMRINKNLPYQKIGGIIYYKYNDIISLLEPQGSA